MEWFTCRVQYVNDLDPLAYSNASFPEPTRPPFHTFSAHIPLADQLAAVHRLLHAPHQVTQSFQFSIFPSLTDSQRKREGEKERGREEKKTNIFRVRLGPVEDVVDPVVQ